jgi:diguanylate cyclase (GGDEF)-like protein
MPGIEAMSAVVEPLLVVLGLAVAGLICAAALLTAAAFGRGPATGRFVRLWHGESGFGSGIVTERTRSSEIPIVPTVRLLARGHASSARAEARTREGMNSAEDLDEVLRGSLSAETVNRTVRVIAWSFILIVLLIVSVSQLWQPAQPLILATLTVAGAAVLVVHELMPPGSLRSARVVVEASAAIVFLTILVMLTGRSSSPFFFLYPLLVGGTALIASPAVTLLLALETAFAYGLAAFSGNLDAAFTREAIARVGINLTALFLLAYAGTVIARVQRRTRDAAIRLSTIDSLTDLYNRGFFFNAIDREIGRSKRFRRGFCLLMMDLDGLKAVNDKHGHYEGDAVIRAVAQQIRSCLRAIDVAARYGGDEFVALLPETDPTGAFVVAEKIRQMASELVVESGGKHISTSLSIGVVSYPEDGQTADELMIAADEAMYSSKRLGKNRVVGYGEPDEVEHSSQVRRGSLEASGIHHMSRGDGDRDSTADETT